MDNTSNIIFNVISSSVKDKANAVVLIEYSFQSSIINDFISYF